MLQDPLLCSKTLHAWLMGTMVGPLQIWLEQSCVAQLLKHHQSLNRCAINSIQAVGIDMVAMCTCIQRSSTPHSCATPQTKSITLILSTVYILYIDPLLHISLYQLTPNTSCPTEYSVYKCQKPQGSAFWCRQWYSTSSGFPASP